MWVTGANWERLIGPSVSWQRIILDGRRLRVKSCWDLRHGVLVLFLAVHPSRTMVLLVTASIACSLLAGFDLWYWFGSQASIFLDHVSDERGWRHGVN
jgi:hypothetical protein